MRVVQNPWLGVRIGMNLPAPHISNAAHFGEMVAIFTEGTDGHERHWATGRVQANGLIRIIGIETGGGWTGEGAPQEIDYENV